ncbi:MAG TPA: hypothetical protein VH062_09855 [Polyangiaceae bacterium]|jgi:hypothetical protein|nr:hypothetical protein [Polyangiaceae bacterium]
MPTKVQKALLFAMSPYGVSQTDGIHAGTLPGLDRLNAVLADVNDAIARRTLDRTVASVAASTWLASLQTAINNAIAGYNAIKADFSGSTAVSLLATEAVAGDYSAALASAVAALAYPTLPASNTFAHAKANSDRIRSLVANARPEEAIAFALADGADIRRAIEGSASGVGLTAIRDRIRVSIAYETTASTETAIASAFTHRFAMALESGL